jgi:rod shape-determining protein MreD
MIRAIAAACIFLFFFALQTSFINSLPGVLALTPFFLALSVYLMQHQSLTIGALWLSLFGFFLDILRVGDVPFETLAYTVAGVVAYVSSRRLFSNRSIYGILGCGILSFGALSLMHTILLFLFNLQHTEPILWKPFSQEILWSGIGMILLLVLLFQFAGRIRSILVRSFLLSTRHETL